MWSDGEGDSSSEQSVTGWASSSLLEDVPTHSGMVLLEGLVHEITVGVELVLGRR